jgi:hypothetical protein
MLSLKAYDNERYGPFLGVSDEGSAAGAIRDAALESPKALALPKSARGPLELGVAVDAERLGGIGETAVGPDEYADIWLACVDRVLVTTNVGTRVNLRFYAREPIVKVKSDAPAAVEAAKVEIAAAFKPFVDTPDKKPRPRTVYVDLLPNPKFTAPRRKAVLKALAKYVTSGKAAGKRNGRAPNGQALGLTTWVRLGPEGGKQSLDAINLAAAAGLKVVRIDGVKRKQADQALSYAGLLDYFPPGIVGPLLRHAAKNNVELRAANLPDTDTIARSTWVGLGTARAMGANLGKYGCFPLTRPEIEHVVQQVQGWLHEWSAAPVFFVDQGLLNERGVDVGNDLTRGIRSWLDTVAPYGVRVVLIDTVDKFTGRRLLKKDSKDENGFLGVRQLASIEEHARAHGIKVLWAGGLGLRDAYEMGKRGVFGIYVTSAAATTIPVGGSYVRDPALAGVKEPSKEAVLRTKILLEAGFLVTKLGAAGANIEQKAERLLAALDASDGEAIKKRTNALAAACKSGWKTHWSGSGRGPAA